MSVKSARRLAAIMFTDIVGFTGLAQRDESLSLAMLDENRKMLRPTFTAHNGREIKTIGDGFLVEFYSALDAARCAYDIQRKSREFNLSLPLEKKVVLRIGIHLGDVIEDREGDILGDAVNVASRIQSFAHGGGVCLTQQVFDHIRNKFELPMKSIGKQSLKNVRVPVEVYKMVMPWDNATENGGTKMIELDRKRIAVLPFANISPDPNDDYFADGMTEEIIDVLSQIQGLRVIARTSVNHYKKIDKPIPQIAQELGVGTILEGSVRKAGNRIRATLQLIDAKTQEHEWSQSYDRNLDDIFQIQSDIAQQVAKTLEVKILAGREQRLERKDTENTSAYLAYLKGRTSLHGPRQEKILREAKDQFEIALSMDGKFARAYSGLADVAYLTAISFIVPFKESMELSRSLAERALEIDPDLAEAHASLANVLWNYEYELERAGDEYKHAISLNPNYASARHWYGNFLVIELRQFAQGYEQLKIAEEEDPLSLPIAGALYWCLIHMRRMDDALKQLAKVGALEAYGSYYLAELYRYYLWHSPDFEKAKETLDKLEKVWDRVRFLDFAEEYYAATGQMDKIREIISEVSGFPESPARDYVLAYAHAALGEMDLCFGYWEKALRVSASMSISNFEWFGEFEQVVKSMVGDQRWKDLVIKLRAARRTSNGP